MYKTESNLGPSKDILDISRLMILRMNAGYQVDQIQFNQMLSTRFLTCQSQYSQKNQKTLLMQGTKVFWQLMVKLTSKV